MRTIAIVNQKGGCGKTTTAVNLAGSLAEDGFRLLVADVDPQSHATLALGIDPEAVDETLYEVLAEPDGAAHLDAVIRPAGERIDVAPSGIALSALEQKLAAEHAEERTVRLARALAGLTPRYDFVLIDCPPNVGLLTFNALRAAREVVVPLETSRFAIHGVQRLLETVGLLCERIQHDLDVRILPTLYDGRTRYARETLAEIRDQFGDLCLDSVIRTNVRLREAAQRGVPIARFARSANGAVDYAAAALELAATPPAEQPAPAAAWTAPAPRQVVVRFRDGQAHDVRIAGDFNGWVPDKGVQSRLEDEAGGRVWTKILSLAPGTYYYRYVVDGQWREDPDNPRRETDPLGEPSSVLVVR